ncbi:hypothetical protein [Nesterenkonia rhizosphaerae]|uniref:Uncharacterized protein n=1 Tax=Nesterenkonia rhizosphaerae TaxID=1348272 RepID=A0ABP9FST0_9MICC
MNPYTPNSDRQALACCLLIFATLAGFIIALITVALLQLVA